MNYLLYSIYCLKITLIGKLLSILLDTNYLAMFLIVAYVERPVLGMSYV